MLNKIMLIGNLGKDPELRYTSSGTPWCTFSLATTETWKDKNGDRQKETEWHDITAFGKLAELCANYLRKGSKAYIEGSIKTNKWQDKEGNNRERKQVKAREVKFLDPPQQSGGYSGGGHKAPQGLQPSPQDGAQWDSAAGDGDYPF